jgi:transposase-like protein
MTAERRRYTSQERAEAVGLAMSVGIREAARRLRIPFRTLAHWTHRNDIQGVVIATEEAIASKLWEAVQVGTEEVLRRMRDPKARLSDVARALEVVSTQHALLSGRSTSRTESTVTTQPAMTFEQRAQLADWIDRMSAGSDDELAEWLASGGIDVIRNPERVIEAGDG